MNKSKVIKQKQKKRKRENKILPCEEMWTVNFTSQPSIKRQAVQKNLTSLCMGGILGGDRHNDT